MKVLIIDNYDSFVYNLAQYIGILGHEPVVFRNDSIDVPAVASMKPGAIILSPGPCTPAEAGVSNGLIPAFCGKIPILGVCLGHQCIGAAFGGTVGRASKPTHGKSSPITHDGKTIFKGLPNPLEGGRYHSLVVYEQGLPDCLEISARTADGAIMGLRHKSFAVEGVQFHPESILTSFGLDLLSNFLGSH